MSARRQPSTTSLSKYARASSPILQNRSLDFCNAFWGIGDGGVDVLFARMRGAARTIEELRNYWKERASIEEEYAKRMTKLAKTTLGRDEIGELRNSLDTVRLETDKQAGFHMILAQQIRADLETPTATFHARQMHHKKTFQAGIEKEFKTKQTQETYVNKAREKYEQDCVRINSYTAQSSLVQGKDLDKITLKLERAQQTVQSNEREFASFAKALSDTSHKWEQSWKAFCDSCQDMEEHRMEFMKDNIWSYANAVSTVCVSDDESCEKIRLALEQMEPEKDMENFVRDYSTGNQIPDPPAFINYNTPDAIPSSSSRPTTRPAQFSRSSQREVLPRQSSVPPSEPEVNTAGIGAGGPKRDSQFDLPLARQPTQSRRANTVTVSGQQPPQVNGSVVHPYSAPATSTTPPSAQNLGRQVTQSRKAPPHDSLADPIDPTAETYIKVGSNAYKVDLSKDPQMQSGSSSRSNAGSPSKQTGVIDPLAKHMEDLKNAVSNSGSVRRRSFLRKPSPDPQPGQGPSTKNTVGSDGRSSSLSPAGTGSTNAGSSVSQPPGPPPVRDYRNSAELVVGVHPSQSRPASPNPPTAAFMDPKPAIPPSDSEVIEGVLTNYHQSLPGERKSISRNNSIRQSPNPGNVQDQNQGQGQNLARPSSQIGHPGIGAHGGSRSNSPQPPSRGPSPAPNARSSHINAPPAPAPAMRSASPNTVGIALDPSGRVMHDEMAQRYQQQQQQQHQHQHQRLPQQHQPPSQPQYTAPPNQQRRTSYIAPPATSTIPLPSVHQGYGITPAPQSIYQPPPSTRPSYVQAPPIQQPTIQQQPIQQQPPVQQPPYVPPYVQPPQQPIYQQPQTGGYPAANHLQRGQTLTSAYYPNGGNPQHQQVANQRFQQTHPSYGYRDQNPSGRTPSPSTAVAPTGQTTEEGVPILFYVKALYDYTATIEEEFDFQAGDIIAVTHTPEDGWWSGELLDEERRQKGRHVFPSNFVCLF